VSVGAKRLGYQVKTESGISFHSETMGTVLWSKVCKVVYVHQVWKPNGEREHTYLGDDLFWTLWGFDTLCVDDSAWGDLLSIIRV
jgi:hypothetical protein